MDTQVRELLERARAAYLTDESLDALELRLHDLCYNVCPHLADDYYTLRHQLLTTHQKLPPGQLVSDTPTEVSDLPVNSLCDDNRDSRPSRIRHVLHRSQTKEKVMSLDTGVFTMGAEMVPPGSYAAQFVGWGTFTENKDKYGVGLTLKFRITEGEHTDKTATRIVSQKTGPKSNLFKFVTSLKGEKPETGEEIRLDDFCGAKGQIVVEETDAGSTRVNVFLREA
jgi:hypothetical protein